MGLKRFILRRLVEIAVIFFVIMTVLFILFRLAPGDPVSRMVDPSMTPEDARLLMESMGLDQPVWTQYLYYLKNAATGNMGMSFHYGEPVTHILLNRLPNRFISPNPKEGHSTIDSIADLAGGMTSADAFVIFPEGGNFTANRKIKAIDRLREGGHIAAAERAAALRNVLPPRPAGTLAAITACPTADLVFVAHTGLDQIATIGDLWTAIPVDKVVEIGWQVLPSERIPATSEGKSELLFDVWEKIDEWVEVRKTTP